LKKIASTHPKIRTHDGAESFHFLDEKSDLRKRYLKNLQYTEGNTATVKVATTPNEGFLRGEHSPAYFWQVIYKYWGGG
jgi:hypothetical protein